MSDNITLPREVAEKALDALEYYRSGEDYQPTPASEAIDNLRTALAAEQPKPEPVGVMQESSLIKGLVIPVVTQELPVGTLLYAAPPAAAPNEDIETLRREETK